MYQKNEKIEQLLQFANELKENDFTVLIPAREEKSTWVKFFKNGQFGTIECDYFHGFNFGTVHKPCKECGTGYGIERQAELTIDNAEKCLIKAPYWATSNQLNAIKQYNDINDFINSIHNKWANYQIL